MTDEQVVLGLTTVVAFGVGSQWVGRRLGFPSLLLLLPAGLLAGATGLVDPEGLFGDSLFPLVTLLVALLLFQAGLDLRFEDLPREARGPVLRLVTVGLAVTFGGATAVLLVATDVPVGVAWVLGAVLTVSGPTVVGPLLRAIRPRAPTGPILAWEGTVLDPLGATLAVVVLNLVIAAHDRSDVHPLLALGGRLGLGVLIGLAGAAVLVYVLSRFLLTDDMEAAVAVLVAVVCFGAAEVLLSEAGLFATVALGVAAANQRLVPTSRISGFGETLEVLIIGILFILLGALVDPGDLLAVAGTIAVVVALLVAVVRPLAVAASLVRTALPGRDRALVAWMDPRGVVAAATAAQFAPTLAELGLDASLMLPLVFGTILGVGFVYGLSAPLVARALGVTAPRPHGVALVGDRPWLLDLGGALRDLGVEVLVVATDRGTALSAANGALPTVSVLETERELHEHLAEAPLAAAVVALEHAAVVSLVGAELVEALGRSHVYVVRTRGEGSVERALEAWAPAPFAPGATLTELDRRAEAGAQVRACPDGAPTDAIVLATVRADGSVDLQPGHRGRHRDGGTTIALVG